MRHDDDKNEIQLNFSRQTINEALTRNGVFPCNHHVRMVVDFINGEGWPIAIRAAQETKRKLETRQ